MNWWLLIPAVLVYLAVGLAVGRWSFVGELGDSSRLQVDDCTPRFCVHDITVVNGERCRPTQKYENARSMAGLLVISWPLLILLHVVCAPFGLMAGAFNRVINRPTRAEKMTQREKDRKALAVRARELGLAVPDEWTKGDDHIGSRARSRVEELAEEYNLEKLRNNPERYKALEEIEAFKIRNKYGKSVWVEEPS